MRYDRILFVFESGIFVSTEIFNRWLLLLFSVRKNKKFCIIFRFKRRKQGCSQPDSKIVLLQPCLYENIFLKFYFDSSDQTSIIMGKIIGRRFVFE